MTPNQPIELSVEFFPPKTPEGASRLQDVTDKLAIAFQPTFFSVTFGAGGSTQEGTLRLVKELFDKGHASVPHLSCVGSSKENILNLLQTYKEYGINRIIALRGDLPSGMGQYGDFHHAHELVSFIRETTGDWFHIEVAAYPEFHPQAVSAQKDREFFAQKVKAGADSAITQYFFNSDAYFQFLEDIQKSQVDIPIIPGIMPITNSSQLIRFSDSCGAEVPRWLRKRLEGFGDDTKSIKSFGHDVITDLCCQLLAGGAPGLHFYSLNQAEPTIAIVKELDYFKK